MTLTRRTNDRKRAFTLIELLVVIAIIAILAAILFPVFARARENARRSSCQSNMKQLALGVMQYTQDYDEKFPLYYTYQSAPNPIAWGDLIQPYIKSFQLFQCPSESTAAPSSASTPNVEYGTDYGVNMDVMYDAVTTEKGVKSLSYLTAPSVSVLMYDTFAGHFTDAYSSGCGYQVVGPCPIAGTGLAKFPTTGNMALRHMDGMNFSFCDGHVKWYKSLNNTTSASVYDDTHGPAGSPTFNLQPQS